MDYRQDDLSLPGGEDDIVYLNTGELKLVFVVESREQNRELLSSLFEHMGEWFQENASHLADNPQIDGSSWRLHSEMIAPREQLPSADDLPDTFPEGWGA